ncbi:MAG: MFS transporter [Actinomycetota bacterium]|jgi:MFS family permease|nr:MFS transporter [Actinomycetota bacterium]
MPDAAAPSVASLDGHEGGEDPPSPGVAERGTLARMLWYRQLESYPNTGPRIGYLSIVVAATIMLYYQLYVGGAVAPQILAHYGMSFRFYVDITVVANAVGAFSSVIAGLADRWGRANMVAYGLGITALLVLFGIPNAPNSWAFAALVVAVGFVEGIILVATPALVRDFSPQLGRASAMGFWTLGPVVGSLIVSVVASNTLAHLVAWQDQFTICGIAGIVVFVIAVFGLRELSPGLRDQLMVSMRDRALIEARAKGIDIAESLRRPWRQMLRFDIILSAFAVSVFLIIYYTAVGFNPIYFETIFGFSPSQANGLGNWLWAFDALALVVVGVLSDWLKVRKPFMVVGAVGAVVMTIIYLGKATAPHTTYYEFVLILTLLAVFLGIAYAPWMASFTETVERRNPALTATGLAVWGWILRIVVAVSVFILPFVVSSTTPLVTYGAKVKALATTYAPEIATAGQVDPTTLSTLAANPSNSAALDKAIAEISSAAHVSSSEAITRLIALSKVPKADLAYLQAHGAAVQQAAKDTPGQWQNWYWVCVAGELVFLPLIFFMAGRWSPAAARRDLRDHEDEVQAELAKLGAA